MIDDNRTRAPEAPRWAEPLPGGPNAPPFGWREAPPLHRFLGGSPLAVAIRLIAVSLIVGVLLMWLDLRPMDVFYGLERFGRRLWALGFDAVREFADYILAGAIIVVPVWLVMRLLTLRRAP